MGTWEHALDGAPLRRHRDWLLKEPGGERLVVHGETFRGARLAGNDYRLASFTDTTFELSSFALAFCSGLEAERCLFDRCEWEFAKLDGARLTDCTFRACHAVGVHFEGARVDGGVFEGTGLSRTSWAGAVAEGVAFHFADFGEARLGTGRFIDCDLRGADFEAADLRGALFEECNLSGARFDGGADPSLARFVRCTGAP